jgi:triacylglycerol lipase
MTTAVTVESAWVEGTDDFLVVPYTHTFIMRRDEVIEQVLEFLRRVGSSMRDLEG